MQETKQRTHYRYQNLRGAYGRRLREVQDVGCDVAGAEAVELEAIRVKLMGEELLGVVTIIADRLGLQPTFFDEESFVLIQ